MIYFYWCHHKNERQISKTCSNSELAWNIGEFLKSKVGAENFKRLPTGNKQPNGTKPNDILIGHLGPWGNATETKHIFTFFPWCGVGSGSWYDNWLGDDNLLRSLDNSKHIFGLCGPYQVALSKKDAKLSKYMNKFTQLDMGLDRKLYPFIKDKFNPIGKRGFYYMGNLYPAKNVEPAIKTCIEKNYRLILTNGYYTQMLRSERIYVTGFVNNQDKSAWEMLRKRCDFIVHPAKIECQPVSIIEASSRGFIPIITKPVSFNCDGAILAKSPDEKDIKNAMVAAQAMPDEELRKRQQKCIAHVEEVNTWEQWHDKVWKIIEKDVRETHKVIG